MAAQAAIHASGRDSDDADFAAPFDWRACHHEKRILQLA
jgi:hypothetical protein